MVTKRKKVVLRLTPDLLIITGKPKKKKKIQTPLRTHVKIKNILL